MAGKFDYARLARTAQRLIDRFGVPETITGYTDSPNPAGANKPPIRTLATLTANAVFLDIDQKLIDGTLIKTGDMKVLLSALNFDIPPKLKGTISRLTENEVWNIEEVKPLNPGGIKLIYTLLVRK